MIKNRMEPKYQSTLKRHLQPKSSSENETWHPLQETT